MQCYGGLDADGQPRPGGAYRDFPCQCYIPYDGTVPSGMGKLVVGHGEDLEPFLALGRLRTPNQTPSLADLEPLFRFARRVRALPLCGDLHVEEFSFVGSVVECRDAPDLWVYYHDAQDRWWCDPLVLDAGGALWTPHRDRRRRAGFRWIRSGAGHTAMVVRGTFSDGWLGDN
jgi:hypothetical protein